MFSRVIVVISIVFCISTYVSFASAMEGPDPDGLGGGGGVTIQIDDMTWWCPSYCIVEYHETHYSIEDGEGGTPVLVDPPGYDDP